MKSFLKFLGVVFLVFIIAGFLPEKDRGSFIILVILLVFFYYGIQLIRALIHFLNK